MKKVLTYVAVFLLGVICAYGIFVSVNDMNKPSKESDLTGKDTSKEEYIYKDDLLELGYSIDEITTIENKVSSTDVKKNLLTQKYDNLVSFITSPYFKIENIQRYEDYYLKNNTYSTDDIVIYVNIGLDNPFYTNITTIDNYKEITAIVNKYYNVNEDITFEDLVTLEKPYSSTGDEQVRKAIYDDLIKMIDTAKEEGINLFVISGYRTHEKQNTEFIANRSASKPGHSEHELGLSVDFNLSNISFEKTKQYEWLKQNSYKYGFIERYQKGKENITGFTYEPWHYRYVGIEVATKIYEENITFEEYIVKYSK